MKTRFLLLTVGLVSVVPLTAQEKLSLNLQKSCCYVGSLDPSVDLYSFESDQEARGAVQRIMAYSGLEPNFLVAAANVDNAAAIIDGDQRLILYNQTFMERIKNRAKTDWAAYAILAHEIGHHLQGHTLTAGGSRPPLELQADKYSGYVMGLMGAELEEALSALQTFGDGPGSATHPPKSARLAAGTNGWKKAQETLGNKPRTNPAALPTTGDVPKAKSSVSSNYEGSVGKLSASYHLTWHQDDRVSGTYGYPSRQGGRTYTLIGSNPRDGYLYLEEYTGSKISARCELSKRVTADKIIWSGTMHNTDGRKLPMVISRSR